MNMRTRLKRGAIGALVALMVFGAGAFADTSSISVTLGTVTGERTLVVTGSDGSSTVGGPVLLAFGNTGTSAPFGAVVTDAMYERWGYHVYSELSDLYPLTTTGAVDCSGPAVSSSAFTVGGVGQLSTTDIDAVLESFLDFEDDITDDVTATIATALLDLGIDVTKDSTTIPIAVNDVPGLLESVRDHLTSSTVISELESLVFMNRFDAVGGTFTYSDAHPDCSGSGTSSPSQTYIQHAAAPASVDLTGLTTAVFDEAASDASLVASEAESVGLLPPGSTNTGSTLYDATASAIYTVLVDLGVDPLLVDTDLATMTQNAMPDLVATTGDLALSLVGQTGVYPSVQTLTLDRDALGDPETGTYHGVMTVTLIDDPDNDADPSTP